MDGQFKFIGSKKLQLFFYIIRILTQYMSMVCPAEIHIYIRMINFHSLKFLHVEKHTTYKYDQIVFMSSR